MRQQTVTKPEFWAILSRLRACYPQKTTEDEFKITVRRYWEDLQGFSREAVTMACDRAWRAHPTWFPALGELYQLAEHCSQTLEIARPDRRITEGEPTAHPDAKAKIQEIVRQLAGKSVGDGEA